MNSITSEAHFRQRVLKYSFQHGVTEASNRFHRCRKAIYEWKARYDGSWKSFIEKPHRPHHNPNEHTKTKTMFEQALADMDIIYHRIRVATPRHNGKVERQHRTDEKRFYKKMKIYSLADGRAQLEKYNKKSNDISTSFFRIKFICLDG